MEKNNSWDSFNYPKNLIMALGINSIKAEEITHAQLKGMLFCVDTLDDKYKYIIESYFRDHKTLNEIAEHFKTNTHSMAKTANKALSELKHPNRLKYIVNRERILSEFAKVDVDIKYSAEENKRIRKLREMEDKISTYEKGLEAISDIIGTKSDDVAKVLAELKIENTSNYISKSFPENIVQAIFGDCAPKELCNDQLVGLEYVLSQFDERERDIIMLRYRDGMTYDTIGKKHNLSKERVRQIIAHTLRKCRMPTRGNYIKYGYNIGSGKVSNEVNAKYRDIENAKLKKIEELNSEIEFLAKNMNEIRALIGDKYPLLISKMHLIYSGKIQNGYETIIDVFNRGEISVRAYNVVMRHFGGRPTLQDLADNTIDNVRKWRNAGERTVTELANLLTKYGLSFKIE